MNDQYQPQLRIDFEEVPEIPVFRGNPVKYTQAELEAKALDYVQSIKPKEYRRLKKSGELDEYCTAKANRARRQAENLIATGLPDQIAWNQAIRSEILESESD